MKKIFSTLLFSACAAALLSACDNGVVEPTPVQATAADTVRDLFALKPAATVDTVKNFRADTSSAANKPYAYYDLDGNAALAANGDTSTWDLAIRTTGIRINGQYQILSSTNFDSLLKAPDTGYTASSTPSWYDYNFSTNIVTPKSGTVLLIKTVTGKYAKLQIFSYYKNNPANPTSSDTARYYTFRYFLQPDGSKNLDPSSAPYTYYSLHTKAEVTDTSAGWDLAFRTTTIKVNGSSQLLSGVNFDTLFTAPTSGYAAGNAGTWFDYSGDPNHTITPKLATVLLVKTADNKYTKIQLLTYYKGFPTSPNGLVDTARYYGFRYFLQSNGTVALK